MVALPMSGRRTIGAAHIVSHHWRHSGGPASSKADMSRAGVQNGSLWGGGARFSEHRLDRFRGRCRHLFQTTGS